MPESREITRRYINIPVTGRQVVGQTPKRCRLPPYKKKRGQKVAGTDATIKYRQIEVTL